MAIDGDSDAARRDAALAVLTTGIAGHPARERLTWALVEQARGRPSPGLTFDADELEDLRSFARLHRVEARSRRLAPDLGVATVGQLAGAMGLERHLLVVVELLATNGIELLVLKGNATARLDHADPGDREVGDVDVLVRPRQLDVAMHVLDTSGYRRAVTHPFARASFFHSETFVHPDGTEIDLHHRLAQPSRTPLTCWAEPDTFHLGGRAVQAMPRTWRFTHAMVHQMKDSPPTVRAVNGLLDLVVMWTKGVDVDHVRRIGREIGLTTLVERGLVRVTDLLGEPTPCPQTGFHGAWAEQKLARALDDDGSTPGYVALAANLAVQPKRLWPSYLRQLLWPTKAYRDELGIALGDQVRHVVRETLGR